MAAPKHPNPYLLLDGYRIGQVRESIREPLGNTCASPGAGDREALGTVVEHARDDEVSLGYRLVETGRDGLVDSFIDCLDRLDPGAHVDRAERSAVGGDTEVRSDRLRVDEEAVRDERRVDVVQGVHDALDRDASQRPAAERDVEAFSREIACLRVMDGEPHLLALLDRQGGACRLDVLGLGIEGVDRRGTGCGESRQPTFAAADVEHAFAVEADETRDRGRLDSGFVEPFHLVLRLVCLDGRAARAVLLRLAARVFEGGAGVRIDELAGLDPLEAMTL